MASVNKVILLGNLGRDPETKVTPAGKQLTEFSMATTFGSGESAKTEWHNIKAWDKNAEVAAKYLTKGSPVYIEGRIETRTYDNKEGVKQYRTEVIVERIQLLGSKPSAVAAQPEGDDPF